MKRFIIGLVAIMTLSSVSLTPIESMPTEKSYKQVTVGDQVLMISSEATIEADLSMLLPPKKLELKELHPEFKTKIGHLESGGNYSAINRYGYLGKYQFSKRTLRRLVKKGYLKLSKDEIKRFRELPYVQEKAMDALLTANLETLRGWKLSKYIGKTVGGVNVTMEGMLAASHLLGPYAVKHYLTHNGSMESVSINGVTVRKYDANGTSLKSYLKHFA